MLKPVEQASTYTILIYKLIGGNTLIFQSIIKWLVGNHIITSKFNIIHTPPIDNARYIEYNIQRKRGYI